MTDPGPAPRIVLYSSEIAWPGAVLSQVKIACALREVGQAPRIVTLDPDIAAAFSRRHWLVTRLPRGPGEGRRLREYLRQSDTRALFVENEHDVRVSLRATIGTDVAVINRVLARPAKPSPDVMTRLAYRVSVREAVFATHTARELAARTAPFMARVPQCVIYDGIDVAELRPCRLSAAQFRQSSRLANEPFVLSLGDLVPDARHEMVLEALHYLGDNAPPLVICGTGSTEARLRERAAGLDVRLTIVPCVADDAMRGMYSAALTAVHSQPLERSLVSLLEAMACGCPVICANGGAAHEIVGLDGAGLLFPTDSVEGLARALHRLVSDPAAAQRTGYRARERVAELFTIEQMNEGYARLIARHLDDQTNPRVDI